MRFDSNKDTGVIDAKIDISSIIMVEGNSMRNDSNEARTVETQIDNDPDNDPVTLHAEQLTLEELRTDCLKVLGHFFPMRNIKLTDELISLGLDSMDSIHLLQDIRLHFGVSLDINSLIEATIEDFVQQVYHKYTEGFLAGTLCFTDDEEAGSQKKSAIEHVPGILTISPRRGNKAAKEALLAAIRDFDMSSILVDEARRELNPVHLQMMSALKAFGMFIPAEYGGLDMKLREVQEVREALALRNGSLCFACDYHNWQIATPLSYASPEIRNALLPEIAKGNMLLSYCQSEPQAGGNITALEATAKRVVDADGPGWLLNGHKTWFSNGIRGHGYVFIGWVETGSARTLKAFYAPGSCPGVEFVRHIDYIGFKEHNFGVLKFNDVRIPDSYMLNYGHTDQAELYDTMSMSRLNAPTACIAAMKASLWILHEFAKTRQIGQGEVRGTVDMTITSSIYIYIYIIYIFSLLLSYFFFISFFDFFLHFLLYPF